MHVDVCVPSYPALQSVLWAVTYQGTAFSGCPDWLPCLPKGAGQRDLMVKRSVDQGSKLQTRAPAQPDGNALYFCMMGEPMAGLATGADLSRSSLCILVFQKKSSERN